MIQNYLLTIFYFIMLHSRCQTDFYFKVWYYEREFDDRPYFYTNSFIEAI